MQFQDAYIPYGCYWSTPFSKWQMSYQTLQPIPFAAEIAKRAIEERSIPFDAFDGACCSGEPSRRIRLESPVPEVPC